MEDLLQQIIKEASGKQSQNLKQAAQIAYDKLFRQHVNRDPPYELRSVCFIALKIALDSKRSNLISLGLNGMHKLIRDERFFIGLEPEDDSNWLPAQLLRSTNGISCTGQNNEETVVNVLRLFLSMACAPTCTLNGRLLIEVLTRSGEFWEYGTRSIKAASLASASQCLRTFCNFLRDEAEELKQTTPSGNLNMMATATIYNEVIPVMQWLCSKLIEPTNGTPKKQNSSLFLMECLLTLTSSLPHDVHSSPHFTSFLWKTFCPSLAASLGFPGRVNIDKKFSYKDAMHMIESENRGFFTRPGLDGPDARCVYQTAVQLARIAGAQGSLRPVLEALYHRMLLLPLPQNRAEPLRCIRDAFKNPQRLIDLSVILHYDKNQSMSDDMELFRLIIDSMEECAATSNSTFGSDDSLHASIECLVALLSSLQTMCIGNVENILSDEVAESINNRFATLKESDYYGPLTYQSLIRLPRDYRDAVAELKQSGFDLGCSDSDNDEHGNDHDGMSNGSGETEGPEDECESSDEQATAEANWLYTQLSDSKIDGESDRKHAKEFAKVLGSQLVPSLLKMHSSIEIDAEIQEFSSSICQQNCVHVSDFDYNLTIINADGIYLSIYSTFLLSLQLTRIGHYDKSRGQIPIPLTEQQFVNSVQSAGVLVYLSSAWLRELYQCILAANPLEALNQVENTTNRCTLIDMICDIGGIGQSQMMSEWQRLQSVTNYMNPAEIETEKRKAAKKLARRLLTCCWDSMVIILSAGLGETEDSRAKKIVKFSQKHLKVGTNNNRRHTGEAALYALSLEGLHAAATLSNSLQLQHLAGKILNMIATNVCLSSGPKLPSSQCLSMELVLSGGLELGSCSEECWLPVFSVCRHVTQLEHDLFSTSTISTASSVSSNGGNKNNGDESSSPCKDKHNPVNYFIDEDEQCVDVYSFLQAPMQNPNTSIATILKAYPNTVSLNQCDTAKALCALSHLADNLFTDAAERLNLPSLCQFLKSLCRASREQLYRNTASKKGKKSWWLGRPWKIKNQSLPLSFLLHRVGEITLKIFRSSRPLLHVCKVWSISGPHLMESALHKDRDISKRAVEYIHDVITALLVEQSELPHFHFNEALLKPFENIMSMQNCDTDVQDQIITCCMMIVEAHRSEIRSGWRPLFGTLAAKKMSVSSVIIDIFRIFLETDNTLVFANAGLDCILCLLSYLDTTSSSSADDDNANNNLGNGNATEFLHDVLKFLERCSTILACLFNMSNTPNIHSTYKIKGISYTHIVDANTQNPLENFHYFGNEQQNVDEQLMISYRSLHIDKDSITRLEDLDETNGCSVLKVWFLLLDGLSNGLILCPLSHQSSIIQTIFKIFRSIFENPGIDFGFYCVNHLLIPMNQDWLRYINKTQRSWSSVEKNFKHCCCMTTDLVVEFIEKSQPKKISDDEEASKISIAANLALKQLLIVLIECSVQPQESVSRIGVSCLKHIIFSIGYLFNEEQWLSVCSAIHRAGTLNLAPLRQLSFAFYENSNSFYGDIATVKVAARRDCTLEEINRIYSLSQQVFQLDSQKDLTSGSKTSGEIKIINEDRSYAFLLYPNSNNQVDGNYVLRIPFRSLVIGLLVSQMFLQLIANILLSGLKCVAETELHSVIYEYNANSGGSSKADMTSDGSREDEVPVKDKKTQFTLSYRAREILFRCLRQYLNSAIEFDYRPGLKFLIQKVANLDFAANLYKQMTSSFIIVFMSLVDSYLCDIAKLSLTLEDLKFIIESSRGDNLIKKKEFFVRNLFVLRDIWEQVAELYVKAVKIMPSTLDHNRLSFAKEINIVENKMVEIQDQLRNYEDSEDDDDDVFLPLSLQKSLEKTPSEESVKIFLRDNDGNETVSTPKQQQQTRENPFNNSPESNKPQQSQAISPEIEQQRKLSIMRDDQSKCKSLTQLIVASMELLKLLPNESTENIRFLLTAKINEAFNMIERFESSAATFENVK